MSHPGLARDCPGDCTVIAPPHEHEHWEPSSSAATPAIVTFADPGVHGLSTGWHGCGVRVPWAAVVAAATAGFDCDRHWPNGATLAPELSLTTPAAAVALTAVAEAVNVDGAVPIEHFNVAPVQTRCAISSHARARSSKHTRTLP